MTALDEADAADATSSFHRFLKLSFPVIDKSGRRFEDTWYYPVICEHAEAVLSGQLTRLVVVQPPNTYKSGIWTVHLPAYDWLTNPWRRYICNSNEKSLVTEFAERCRDLILSAWYQRMFRPQWRLRQRQNAVQFYATTEGGARRGVSTGSAITGKKAHIIVSDDLHDSVKVSSPVVRQSDKLWFTDGLSDRVIHEKESPIVLVGHRADPDDMASECIANGWPLLHIPEEWEDRLRKTYPVAVNGLTSDPRQQGEFLRPHRVDQRVKDQEIRERGVVYWYTKRQGDPREQEGSLFPSDKPARIPCVPVGTVGVLFWDTAATVTSTSSSTSGTIIGRTPAGRYVVCHNWRFKAKPDDRDRQMMSALYDSRRIPGLALRKVVIEHPGGSGGVQVGEIWVRQYAGYNITIRSVSGRGSKDFRAGPLSSQWCGGNVDVVDGDWTKPYLDRMQNAHNRTERDDMDSSSGAFNEIFAPDLVGDDDPVQTAERTSIEEFAAGTFSGDPDNPFDKPY